MVKIGEIYTAPDYGFKRIAPNDHRFFYDNYNLTIEQNSTFGKCLDLSYIDSKPSKRNRLTFNFKGTKLRIIGKSTSSCNNTLYINIDGSMYEANHYFGAEINQCLLFEILNLSNSEHKVSVFGERMMIDSFEIDSFETMKVELEGSLKNLSNQSTIVTRLSNPNSYMFSKAKKGIGLKNYYFEFEYQGFVKNSAIGIVSSEIKSNIIYPSIEGLNILMYRSNGSLLNKETTGKTYAQQINSFDIIGVKVNGKSKIIEFLKNNISQGFLDYSSIEGEVFPAIMTYHENENIEANFGHKPFKYEIPLGYVSLDEEQDETNRKNLLENSLIDYSPILPLDSFGEVSANQSHRIFLTGLYEYRSRTSKSKGKYYFEIQASDSQYYSYACVGIAKKTSISPTLYSPDVRAFHLAYMYKYPEGTAHHQEYHSGFLRTGEVYSFLVDLDNHKLEVWRNGISLGVTHENLDKIDGEVNIIIKNSSTGINTSLDLNLGNRPFFYQMPDNYECWNGSRNFFNQSLNSELSPFEKTTYSTIGQNFLKVEMKSGLTDFVKGVSHKGEKNKYYFEARIDELEADLTVASLGLIESFGISNYLNYDYRKEITYSSDSKICSELNKFNTTYIYVDCLNGSDSNNGTSKERAVRTLSKAVEILGYESTVIFVSEGVYSIKNLKTLIPDGKSVDYNVEESVKGKVIIDLKGVSTEAIKSQGVNYNFFNIIFTRSTSGLTDVYEYFTNGSSASISFHNCVFEKGEINPSSFPIYTSIPQSTSGTSPYLFIYYNNCLFKTEMSSYANEAWKSGYFNNCAFTTLKKVTNDFYNLFGADVGENNIVLNKETGNGFNNDGTRATYGVHGGKNSWTIKPMTRIDSKYGENFSSGDVISVLADFDNSTLEFWKNGKSMGVIKNALRKGLLYSPILVKKTRGTLKVSFNFGSYGFKYNKPEKYIPWQGKEKSSNFILYHNGYYKTINNGKILDISDQLNEETLNKGFSNLNEISRKPFSFNAKKEVLSDFYSKYFVENRGVINFIELK